MASQIEGLGELPPYAAGNTADLESTKPMGLIDRLAKLFGFKIKNLPESRSIALQGHAPWHAEKEVKQNPLFDDEDVEEVTQEDSGFSSGKSTPSATSPSPISIPSESVEEDCSGSMVVHSLKEDCSGSIVVKSQQENQLANKLPGFMIGHNFQGAPQTWDSILEEEELRILAEQPIYIRKEDLNREEVIYAVLPGNQDDCEVIVKDYSHSIGENLPIKESERALSRYEASITSIDQVASRNLANKIPSSGSPGYVQWVITQQFSK